MSDTVDDAAGRRKPIIRRWLGNVAGSDRQAKDPAAGSPQRRSPPK